MAIKIADRISWTPGARSTTPGVSKPAKVENGTPFRGRVEPGRSLSIDGPGAGKARIGAMPPRKPGAAAQLLALRVAFVDRSDARTSTAASAMLAVPPPTLSVTPGARPRRRLPKIAAADHEGYERDPLESDEHRPASESEPVEAGARPHAGLDRPLGHVIATSDARPVGRAEGTQPLRLQLGTLAPIASGRRASTSSSRASPHDGNSFMSSLVHIAAEMLRQRIALPSSVPLSATMLRQHMAAHMIDVFATHNAGAADGGGKLAGRPYAAPVGGVADPESYDFSDPRVQRLFAETLGEQQAERCAKFSPAQKSQVLDMATDRLAGFSLRRPRALGAAILPQVATEAFPGLRLEVISGRGPTRYGSGAGPVHAILFDPGTGHYKPAPSEPTAGRS